MTSTRRTTFRTLLRLTPYARPALPRLALGAVAALLAGLVALAIPQVLAGLVDGVLSAVGTGSVDSGDSGTGTVTSGQTDPTAIWSAVWIVLGLGILEAIMIALRRWFVLTPGTHIEARMRNGLYARLQDLPVSFHDRWPSGQLLSRAVSDLTLIRRWVSFGLVLLVVNFVTIIVGVVILFSMNWLLGLIFVVCSIPIWIYGYVFEEKYSVIARRSQDQAGDLATTVEESVHGIRVLKAFGRGSYALKNFTHQAEDLRGIEIEKARAIAGIWLWLLLVPDVAFAICLITGVWLTARGDLSVGELAAFFATATVLRFPVESIGFLLSMTFDARTATDRFFDIMDTPNEIVDPENVVVLTHSVGRLAFENVHFRYPDSPERFPDLLDGVNLILEPGETMALVGLTGSGKSTLTALTTRLHDVTGGAITLDGVDVRDLSRAQLRRHLAMAFEDATLFSASVRDNVLLGHVELDDAGSAALDRAGGTPSGTARERADAVLDSALAIAQAGFVYDLPGGVDTLVGEEGMSLSGGQRQRIALARAVAAHPAVLILDDPLSALDVHTESLVEAALREVLVSTTTLVVAHRPSTVMLADRVALLEDGRITAVGTHSELLATSRHYSFVISSLEDEVTREAERVEDTL